MGLCPIAVSAEGSGVSAGGSIVGGIAIPLWESSDEFGPGFNLEGVIFANLNENSAIGMKLGFNRWSLTEEGFGVTATFSIADVDFSPLMRISFPVNENSALFVQASAGLHLVTMRLSASDGFNSESDSETETHGGYSLAAGLRINKFEIKPQYSFTATDGEETIKTITISGGFAF